MESELIGRLRSEFSGKKVLVVGLGIQGGGVGVARFFAELGAEVIVTDLKNEEDLLQSIKRLESYNIQYSLGGHKLEDFLNTEIIFKGPSVPWDLPELIEAEKKGIPVEMEVSFFASLAPAKIIGVTGTRGKSTTATIIYDVLREQGRSAYLAGNVAHTSTLNLLKKVNKDDFAILELSSWALSGFHKKKLSPHIAILTNIYADHLNYYKNMDDYIYDKKAIYLYQKQSDYLIANYELQIEIEKGKPKSQVIYFSENDFEAELSHLRGGHNRQNAEAALTTAKVLNLNIKQSLQTIKNFKGLPYRQQKVGEKNNVIFINDTTSTTPVSTIMAIKTFKNHPIILILGGNAKNLPYDNLIKELKNVSKIVLLAGSFTDQILPILEEKYPEKITQAYSLLKSAVLKARELADDLVQKSYILFSPAATSFAMFKNEFDRGDEFNKIVKELV